MSSVPSKPRTLEGLKSQAVRLRKETGCKHTKALEMVARIHGWNTYAGAKYELERRCKMTVYILKPRQCGKTFAAVPPLLTREDRATARIALYAAALLRNVDSVALRDLGEALATAAAHDCIPRFAGNSHLVRIMQRLGWRKQGYAGAGRRRSPVYVREATRQ